MFHPSRLVHSSAAPVWRACLLAAACWGAAAAQAQAVRPELPQNVVQLSASGTVEVPQDLLTISLTATRDGADAAAVQTQLKTLLDTALAEARKAAQPGQLEVRTGNFSLYPRYGRDGRISGWQGSTELVLEGRDFARISSTAGKVSGLTLGNVAFGLSRDARQRVEADAQAQAIERFKAKAGDVAKSFGFAGYTLRELAIQTNDQGYMPRPRVMMAQAKASSMEDAPVPVEAGKSAVVVNVSGSVQLR